jgi:superfamily II DNA/RNA helicase
VKGHPVIFSERTLIFVNTAESAAALLERFSASAPRARVAAFHSEVSEAERIIALRRFHRSPLYVLHDAGSAAGTGGGRAEPPTYSTLSEGDDYIDTLICTNLAARGIDFSLVSYVIQAEFALNITDFLHRIGRAARLVNRTALLAAHNNDKRLAALPTPASGILLAAHILSLYEERDRALAETVWRAVSARTDVSAGFSFRRMLRKNEKRREKRLQMRMAKKAAANKSADGDDAEDAADAGESVEELQRRVAAAKKPAQGLGRKALEDAYKAYEDEDIEDDLGFGNPSGEYDRATERRIVADTGKMAENIRALYRIAKGKE